MSFNVQPFDKFFDDLKDLFRSIDTNSDRVITQEKLTDFLIKDGISSDIIPDIMDSSSMYLRQNIGLEYFGHVLANSFIFCP